MFFLQVTSLLHVHGSIMMSPLSKAYNKAGFACGTSLGICKQVIL